MPRPKLNRPAAPSEDSRGPAVRILPVMIVAAVCLLGLRIQVVVSDMTKQDGAELAVSQSTALAQQAQPAAAASEGEAAEGEDKPAEGAPAEGEAASAEGEDQGEGAAAAIKPSDLTKSEIDTLQRLAERREVIERREREIQQKDSLVKAAEQRLDQKIAQMQELEKQLQALVQRYDEKKKGEIEQLIKIYTAMKPKDAARIFNDLSPDILVPVVVGMKEAKLAPVLALMDDKKARELTEQMSVRRQVQMGQGQ
jgi:flagellar motility protein MotE (MotC chaperone)